MRNTIRRRTARVNLKFPFSDFHPAVRLSLIHISIKNKPIMSINYSIAMLGNPIDEDAPKKAYAKSQYTNICLLYTSRCV